MKLFEYAIIYVPNDKDKKEGEKACLVIPVSHTLASDISTATLIAARKIPEQYMNKLESIQVIVRPF